MHDNGVGDFRAGFGGKPIARFLRPIHRVGWDETVEYHLPALIERVQAKASVVQPDRGDRAVSFRRKRVAARSTSFAKNNLYYNVDYFDWAVFNSFFRKIWYYTYRFSFT